MNVMCVHQGPNRYTLSPQVIESRRDATQKVCKYLLWTPGPSLRTCCIENKTDPIARVLWWVAVNARTARLKDPFQTPPRKRVAAEIPAIFLKLAAVVPLPTHAETQLTAAWEATDDQWLDDEDFEAWHLRRLEEARSKLGSIELPLQELTYAEAMEILDVDDTYTEALLKAAYRKAAFASHPDREGGSHTQFLRVSAAYEILRDA